MNIFLLSRDPELNAEFTCDKHVVKMIVEHCQLLSSALRLNGVDDDRLYKTTHKNHPCAIWSRQSKKNFQYLIDLTEALTNEYTHRYGKIHKSTSVLNVAKLYVNSIPDGKLTNLPQCMPDDCKCRVVTKAYRNYYVKYKANFATWKNRPVPEWFKNQ